MPAMPMGDYLNEIRDAATRVLATVWAEEEALTAIRERINSLVGEAHEAATHARAVDLNAVDPADVMLATGSRWEAHFAGAEATELEKDGRRLAMARLTREFSVGPCQGRCSNSASRAFRLSTANGQPRHRDAPSTMWC